ncbi:LYR motif-containing protein 2 [Coemansia sp. RSA 455]|nr:LYR motif-containing protein 2 [Coemansia sp. S155-1]KAJ2241908.1 LYR motif-containing protein 2 [Coemansia sp. RSA 455]KAJ2441686.1 LYR motif-containing protein 2 [Coemansia sp. RSA 2337]
MTTLTRFWPASQACYSTRTKARPVLSLQQFIQRGQVLSMYRKYMRLTKQIPDKSSRRELREWIRGDFDRYRTESDPRRIDVLLAQASRQYKNMESGMFPML